MKKKVLLVDAADVFCEVADTVPFTCGEADRACAVIAATRGVDDAVDFLAMHVLHDNESADAHFKWTDARVRAEVIRVAPVPAWNVDTAESFEVSVVGAMWMPDATAAMGPFTILRTSLPDYGRADDESKREYLLRMVECAAGVLTGDLRGIDDIEIIRVRVVKKWRTLEDGTVETRHRTRVKVLREWSDGGTAWWDCHGEVE